MQMDIAYVVDLVSQFMYNQKEVHLQVVYRILHYLKVTLEKGVLFKENTNLSLESYTNVDYARSVVDVRSTIG